MKIRHIRPFESVVFYRGRRCDGEVGLLPFARVALLVSRAVLPRYNLASLPAAFGRCDHRPSGRRDGAPVARGAQEKPAEDPRGRGRYRLGAGRGQHLFRAAHASSRAKPLLSRHWSKWVVVADVDQQFLLAQTARRGPWNDCTNLPAVVEMASR
jgi:hypothetical protein